MSPSSYFIRSYEERYCLAWDLDEYLKSDYNIGAL
jgi:hypothetical protein